MTDHHDHSDDINYLRERVEYLESVNRWHMDALAMLISMEEVHGDATPLRDPMTIFATARQYLGRLADFSVIAFLTVDEEDSSFTMADPGEIPEGLDLNAIVDDLIEHGEFAWALGQNRPVEVKSRLGEQRMLLHVLTTKTRVRGMFLGLLQESGQAFAAPVQNLMSIILNNSAYALESAALYQLISEQNRSLERKVEQRTREMEYQYVHDHLTGLPNRLMFQDRLQQAMVRCHGEDELVAVILIDLDMFKRINDSLGHAAGDQLLQTLGQRLDKVIQAEAFENLELTLARLGGDEFAILVSQSNSIDPLTHLIHHIIEQISCSIELEGEPVYSTCSIGVSLYPQDGRDVDSLLNNAGAAMSHAKRLGRNHYQFYAEEINQQAFHHLKLENQLRLAIERDELFLLYQPKVDLHSGRVVGAEALVRWQHPEMGLVSPGEFIPVAEYTGLITAVGECVFKAACERVREWLDAGFDDFRMGINLSPLQFRQPDLLESMTAIIKQSGIEPRYLEVEITEGTIVEDVEAAIGIMQRLHQLGVAISIDDFGTGYSSLSYLKRFPIDTLKIDRSFVRDITTDSDDASIVVAIIGMAHNMGMNVIAEGVEEAAQLTFLRALKCDEIQGFLVSKPVPSEQFMALMRSDRLIP